MFVLTGNQVVSVALLRSSSIIVMVDDKIQVVLGSNKFSIQFPACVEGPERTSEVLAWSSVRRGSSPLGLTLAWYPLMFFV